MIDQITHDAILRAADYFDAHLPARYCLARALNGEEVSPTSTFARSWCALGRIAYELDIGYPEGVLPSERREGVYDALVERGIDTSSILIANDEATTGKQVADMLREYADA